MRYKDMMKEYGFGLSGGILTSFKSEDFFIGTKAILLHHILILYRIADINVDPEWNQESGIQDHYIFLPSGSYWWWLRLVIMGSLAAEGVAAAVDTPPHVVCVPYPAQGHVTPMLKLAKLLHARGFHVTFVNTEFNHRRLLHSRGPNALDGVHRFRFAAIPDGLPLSDANATQDVPALCYSTMTNCLPHLLSLLTRLNADSSGSGAPPAVTCLVADGVMSFGYDAAREIGVPCAALWTASACGLAAYRHYHQLVERGLVPFKDEAQLADGAYLDVVVHGAHGM
ncbi:UDP-glycosyltransferase 85A2-like isoform X1 [Panicum miliaceum]|uniref:UDP-glycosyltransferase 85A2-like isoform X1 n=1 Tax=Panicum miliaceum TaxID=4540 RepID=A0A3L6QE62_PANMI|nr:UDP-glycosyltransferase 85A2-like isoform X1 [Panicum miliaceum]